MNDPRRTFSVVLVLWVNALLLGAILLALLARSNSPRLIPMAFGDDGKPTMLSPQPIAGGGGVFLMPAQFSDHVWGCYVMDIDHQTLVAYTCSGSPPQLRLAAARSFTYDLRFKNFNTDKPWPEDVKKLLEKQQEVDRGNTAPAPPPPAESQPRQD